MDFISAKQHGSRGVGSATMAAGMLVALLALYVLSPLPWLLLVSYSEGSMPRVHQLLTSLMIVYMPLDWLYENVPFVGRFYDWYLLPVK